MGHAQQFAGRIKELYGVVPGSQEFTADQSFLQPPADQTDIEHVVDGVIAAETGAIEHYNAVISFCADRDPRPRTWSSRSCATRRATGGCSRASSASSRRRSADVRRRADEEQAAAQEAAAIGGPHLDPDLSDAERVIAEGGEGESEGFELAEKQLGSQRHPRSGHPTATLCSTGSTTGARTRGAEYGEADHEGEDE